VLDQEDLCPPELWRRNTGGALRHDEDMRGDDRDVKLVLYISPERRPWTVGRPAPPYLSGTATYLLAHKPYHSVSSVAISC
jgi:hypothetical protein